MENITVVPLKTKIELSYDPEIPLLGIYPENHNSKRYMHPNVHCNTIYNSQDIEATRMSINRGMDKDVVHIYKGILLRHKKEQNFVICREMDDLQTVIQSVVSQKKKNKYHILTHLCGV